jgi:hypothetical protein
VHNTTIGLIRHTDKNVTEANVAALSRIFRRQVRDARGDTHQQGKPDIRETCLHLVDQRSGRAHAVLLARGPCRHHDIVSIDFTSYVNIIVTAH